MAREVTYEFFGRLFIERVFNAQRIIRELNKSLSGKKVSTQMKAGGGLATVTAAANLSEATIRPLPTGPGRYVEHDVFVPLSMNLDVAVGPYHEQFSVDAKVQLRIWIQCVDEAGLLVWIGIPDVPPQCVQVQVTGKSWMNIISLWPGFTDEVKKGIAKAFSDEIKSPATVKSRFIPIQRMAETAGDATRAAIVEEAPEGLQAPEPPKFEDYGFHMAPLPDLAG